MASTLNGTDNNTDNVLEVEEPILSTLTQEASQMDDALDDSVETAQQVPLGAADVALQTELHSENVLSSSPVSLAISTKISAAIVHPLASLNSDADDQMFSPVVLNDLKAIAQHPFFAGPLNRATAQFSGLSEISIKKNHLRRLGHNTASQLALLLTTGDPAISAQACLLIGALVLHKHLLSRALKAEREALQQLVGEDIYRTATREAPVLHASLAELDDGSFSIPSSFAINSVQMRETGMRIIAVGQRVLHDFVHIIEPSLLPLFDFRHPSSNRMNSDQSATSVMTDRHSAHITRLLRRRFEPWLHTIV